MGLSIESAETASDLVVNDVEQVTSVLHYTLHGGMIWLTES